MTKPINYSNYMDWGKGRKLMSDNPELLLVPADFNTVAHLMQQIILQKGNKDDLRITFKITKKGLHAYMQQSQKYICKWEADPENPLCEKERDD